MSNLLQTGTIFRTIDRDSVLVPKLPLGVYRIEMDSLGIHLKERESFRELPKVYGNHPRWAKRILDSFFAKDENMGVLLTGEKGGGKSLLARLVAEGAAERGMSTLVLESDHGAKGVGRFLSALTEPTIVFVDEFEKIFGSQRGGGQEEFLSLLDGTSGTRHLFLFTVNKTDEINEHLLNRPSRIHYRIDFAGLDRKFISDYCADQLERSEELESILLIASCFEKFNFDMLKSLVEEINRYGETALEAARLLNISPENTSRQFSLLIEDQSGRKVQSNKSWRGNLLTANSFVFEYLPEGEGSWPQALEVLLENAVSFDPREDVYSFRKDGLTITLRGQSNPVQGHWLDTLAAAP